MATPKCQSYLAFGKNLELAGAFLEHYDEGRKPGRPETGDVQLLRGAVVFAMAALDAFLRDVILEVVPSNGPAENSNLAEALQAIAKSDHGLALRVALAKDPREVFREALGKHLEAQSFQGQEAVRRCLAYVGAPVTGRLEDWVRSQTAIQRLDQFKKMRDRIVHKAVRDPLKRRSVKECIEAVTQIADRVHDEVAARYFPAKKPTGAPASKAATNGTPKPNTQRRSRKAPTRPNSPPAVAAPPAGAAPGP